MNEQDFVDMIWQKSSELYRDMPWRDDTRPYSILVSEVMLQQTQVERVIPKFNAFMERFPTFTSLANAALSDVIIMWSGLGYNRRAKYLYESAKIITSTFDGSMPQTQKELMILPGIGKNTSAAIMNYSFNLPVPFVETNIRTVYFYHFFEHTTDVSDAELLEIIQRTIDSEHPREWFWALMDYGAYLKKNGTSLLEQSRHYKKQSPLIGSVRQTRGIIIRLLTAKSFTITQLKRAVNQPDRFDDAFTSLINDGLVTQSNAIIHLTK